MGRTATLYFRCPNCSKRYGSSASSVGKRYRCQGCGRTFRIKPDRPGSSPSPARDSAASEPWSEAPPSDDDSMPLHGDAGEDGAVDRYGLDERDSVPPAKSSHKPSLSEASNGPEADRIDRKQIEDYFTPDPEPKIRFTETDYQWLIISSIAGICLAVVGVGILILLGVVAYVVHKRSKQQKEREEIARTIEAKPSDAQIDRWLAWDRNALFPKAIGKAGVDPEDLVGERQILVYGLGEDIALRWRKGKDNILRFSHDHVSILMFTEHQVLIYQCILDHTSGKALNEGISEYFYRFVAGVAIENLEGLKIRISGHEGVYHINTSKTFSLTISGAAPIRIVLGDPELVRELGVDEGEIPTSHVESAIQGIRKMIREKNMG